MELLLLLLLVLLLLTQLLLLLLLLLRLSLIHVAIAVVVVDVVVVVVVVAVVVFVCVVAIGTVDDVTGGGSDDDMFVAFLWMFWGSLKRAPLLKALRRRLAVRFVPACSRGDQDLPNQRGT